MSGESAAPRIEVFTGPGCAYCEQAKALLADKGLAFVELDIAADPALLEEFRRRLPRVKAIPQIFVDGRHVGGLDDLRLAIDSLSR